MALVASYRSNLAARYSDLARKKRQRIGYLLCRELASLSFIQLSLSLLII
jgi:hypothetical protein